MAIQRYSPTQKAEMKCLCILTDSLGVYCVISKLPNLFYTLYNILFILPIGCLNLIQLLRIKISKEIWSLAYVKALGLPEIKIEVEILAAKV